MCHPDSCAAKKQVKEIKLVHMAGFAVDLHSLGEDRFYYEDFSYYKYVTPMSFKFYVFAYVLCLSAKDEFLCFVSITGANVLEMLLCPQRTEPCIAVLFCSNSLSNLNGTLIFHWMENNIL